MGAVHRELESGAFIRDPGNSGKDGARDTVDGHLDGAARLLVDAGVKPRSADGNLLGPGRQTGSIDLDPCRRIGVKALKLMAGSGVFDSGQEITHFNTQFLRLPGH